MHYLQSKAWERYQRSIGTDCIRDEGSGWSELGLVEDAHLGMTRLYAPYGPTFSSEESLKEALDAFEQHARKLGCIYVRVEPQAGDEAAEAGMEGVLERLGYHKVDHIQPEDTWILDVDRPWDEVFSQMDSNHRRRYRGAEKRGVSVRVSHDPADMAHLVRLMGQVEQRNDVMLRPEEYLMAQANALLPTKDAALYLATVEEDGAEKVVSADFVLADESTVLFMHNGTDTAYYKTGANVIMQVQIVRDACEQHKRSCDFYGIAPEGSGPDHPWAGFSAFKRSFGGGYRHYLGTWEKPIKPLQYAAYDLARNIANKL